MYHNLINYDQGYRQRNLVVISIFRRFSLYTAITTTYVQKLMTVLLRQKNRVINQTPQERERRIRAQFRQEIENSR